MDAENQGEARQESQAKTTAWQTGFDVHPQFSLWAVLVRSSDSRSTPHFRCSAGGVTISRWPDGVKTNAGGAPRRGRPGVSPPRPSAAAVEQLREFSMTISTVAEQPYPFADLALARRLERA